MDYLEKMDCVAGMQSVCHLSHFFVVADEWKSKYSRHNKRKSSKQMNIARLHVPILDIDSYQWMDDINETTSDIIIHYLFS